ncbi:MULTISPECIES: LTA synthase family protein [Planococcus]|uniref:Glycerol phosphate lipoteichoic acid synthase n=1 Tax=Planococcus faecalis TaxID=1598147 RepID=A0ABN4XLD4_9BACL|nr:MULTISPECIES: LTA synthase family protein [Planococcus]AQU78505.1 glycerol phosphate lipoteichoic acid synthase [Planococcus faecalis]MDJ0331531.1 LTA synthase family protein [Planococcus sp. S3-L1]OHX51490.1 glycerol phosphate lipoteichoic acid synthase [Planococcus faecalis]
MEKSKSLNKKIVNKYVPLFVLAVAMLWIKTYVSQKMQFKLDVDGVLQEFLLFINPLGSALLLLSLSFFFKGARKYWSLLLIYTLMSVLLYANVVYFRFFSDFITLPTLFQTQNFGDLGGSIITLIQPTDVLFFVDVIVLAILIGSNRVKKESGNFKTKVILPVITIALAISFFNLALAEKDRPQLLTRGFDRSYIVKYLGMYNYALYDTVETLKSSSQRVLADSDDKTEVLNYTKSNYAKPNEDYFGAAEDMNVVYLHLESFQTFLLDYELDGEEVTPFLNSLIGDQNTLYFDNFFHQTAQGKTSDAEFMLENSLYGLPKGSAFITKGQNTYQAAPAILKDKGYTSAVFHGNNGTFWNRSEIYKSFGYDHFFDIESYTNLTEEDMAEYGVMDKPFFEQSGELLETLPEPFYTKLMTVSHHFPYHINQDLTTIGKATTGDPSVDNYFQTARYADEAIEQFFTQLEESGLDDNTMVVLYGDHYGISDNHNQAMEQILSKEITPVENANLQRVPLFIHVPGMKGGVDHTYGGQIDLLPTVMHMLGVETENYIHFGADLLSEDHEELVTFRNGDYVSPEIYSIGEKYYNPKTGLPLEDTQLEQAEKFQQQSNYELELSDQLVTSDLLRFYTPDGFTPIDPADYNYQNDKVEEAE